MFLLVSKKSRERERRTHQERQRDTHTARRNRERDNPRERERETYRKEIHMAREGGSFSMFHHTKGNQVFMKNRP